MNVSQLPQFLCLFIQICLLLILTLNGDEECEEEERGEDVRGEGFVRESHLINSVNNCENDTMKRVLTFTFMIFLEGLACQVREAEEKEDADEDHQVGGEEGASEVSMVRENAGFETKRGTKSSCNCAKQTLISIVIIPLRNMKHNDDVGDEEDGGRDGGVVLQEGGNQGEAHHSHQGVRENENRAF